MTPPDQRTANVRESRADIQEVIDRLNHMQRAGVIPQYAIGGAVGASFYMEPLLTEDVDVFMPFPADALIVSAKPMIDYFLEHGGTMPASAEATSGQVLLKGWLVQFLPPVSPLTEEAIAEAQLFEIDANLTARVMTLPHLAALALETGRPKDKARLLQFVSSGKLDMQRFEDIISRYELSQKWAAFRKAFNV